ncbi:uncharacterized protein LOC116259035 [Nymphaea colorata]|nr:uncharacterized protein LOC116259035 [Nymphaea colorata]
MENALIGGLVGSAFEKSRVPLEEDCLIHFDPPLRLLRGPLPSSDASSSFVLVFRDEQALRRALLDTEARVRERCNAGARIGCSVSATKSCKPPWWACLARLLGPKLADFEEREKCEEREMEACLAASTEACLRFAKEKWPPSCQDAQIAYKGKHGSRNL